VDHSIMAKTCAKGYLPLLLDSAALVCQYGGIIKIVEVSQAGTTQGPGQSVQISNWLTGYTIPSQSGGRDAYAANLPSIFEDWYAYEKLAGIGKWTLMEYPNLIATPGSDGELLDENGYYWIAVGPRIINKQYDDNGNLTVRKNHNAQNILVMGKYADVVLEHISTVDTVYLYCRIGDIKAHTWIGKGDSQNGLSQTGVPYPNNASGEAADLNSADGSTVEFMGHPTYKSNGDPDNGDMSKYRLLKIIVHD